MFVAAGEGIAKNKRLKLEYEELLPSNSAATEMWNKLLTNEDLVDKDDLTHAVKSGKESLVFILTLYLPGGLPLTNKIVWR